MPQDAQKLREERMNTLASILAVGVDPEKAILFFQEDVRVYFILFLKCFIGGRDESGSGKLFCGFRRH